MNFNLINTFNINLPGNTSNLTIEHIDDECIKLIYSNTTKTQIGIYEYYICIPTCFNGR